MSGEAEKRFHATGRQRRLHRKAHTTHKEGRIDTMPQSVERVNEIVQKSGEKEDKYLTFALAGEGYGIGILKVREIIGMLPVTSIPQTPDYLKGVINLRGRVIPVVDLRLKFNLEAEGYTERTCIIVVEITAADRRCFPMGIVVDSVTEVLNIKPEEIEETPCFGTRLNTDFLLGMAKLGSGVKILLDIQKVLTSEEVAMVEQAA